MTSPSTTLAESPVFPRRSVLILSMVLTTLGFTLTSLFPYVGIMTKHLLGLSTTNEAGYYVGFIASSFTFGRFLTAYFWGYVADKIGRKPVVIVGLLAIAACSVAFGLSTSFAMAVTARFVLGLMNGIMPAVRTMTREVCGPELVVLGMTYVGGSNGIGIVIGTAVGGLLAMPASNYPNVFSPTGIFATYPFLLPNLFGACYALLMLPLVIFYLPETRTFADARDQAVPSREVSPDSTRVESASFRRGITRGRLAYQPLDDQEKREMRQQQQQQRTQSPPRSPMSAAFGLAQRTDGVSQSRRAGSRADEAVELEAVELVSLDRRKKRRASRYELLQGDDNDLDEREADIGASRGGDSAAALSIPPRDRGGSVDADGDKGNAEMPRPAQLGEEDPGVFGAHGLLSIPKVKLVIFIAAIVQVISIGFDEVYPLWAVSTIDVGGLGWTPEHIGKVLAVSGIFLAFFQLGLAPSVIKRIGMVTWQRGGCLLAVAVLFAVPSAKSLSWNEGSLFVATFLSDALVIIGMGSNKLALTVTSTNIVPQHQRGKLGGLFMTAESLGRFLGPASFSTTFAWSISTYAPGWVNYHFVFYLSAATMVAVLALSWRAFTVEDPAKPSERSAGGSGGGSAAVGGGNGAAADISAKEVFPSSSVIGAESSMPVDSPQGQQDGNDALEAVI
ncbi:unnamed protein product [Scytosiphon promiscuus]